MANPDIGAAGGGDPAFPRHHFFTWGINEGRLQINRASLPKIESARREKLNRLTLGLGTYEFSYLDTAMRVARAVEHLPITVPLSVRDYDPEVGALVDSRPDGMFLDIGAGLTANYRDNVVYADIAAMPTTDVLCFSDSLPFETDSFDGAICLSVLEHVPDPWQAARELVRVVRPGGKIIVDWPFLQPVHSYPDHYFNATERGARFTFEQLGAATEAHLPSHLHPIFTLRWMLWEWESGLGEAERESFRNVKIGDVLAQTPDTLLRNESWVADLSNEVSARISAGTRLTITP